MYKAGSRATTRFIEVEVKSYGKVIAKGIVDLKPTLDRIRSGQQFPHRHNGTLFRNEQGKLLPEHYDYYREYVHPTPGISEPGPQRIIVGQGGELYYTPDHYDTFIPIN